MARGLHYAGLTDAAWSADGKTLFVTSSDGYVSILSFGDGELGEVYVPPEVKIVEKVKKASDATDMGESKVGADASSLPSDSSKQPESNNKEAIINADALEPVVKETDSAEAGNELKKVTFSEVNEIKQIECRQPAVNMLIPKKKKKKIAPTPMTTVPTEQVSNSSAEEGGEPSEKKRSAEEVSAAVPSTTEALEGAPINTLVAKKKQKVAGSSTPVATS
jgi:chromatin assembly factor 1 subunit B